MPDLPKNSAPLSEQHAADVRPRRNFAPSLKKLVDQKVEREAAKLYEQKITDVAEFEAAVAEASTPAKRSPGRPRKPKTTATPDDWDSPIVAKADEAKALLTQAGIESPAVIKVLLREVPRLCERLDILPNRFVWTNGVRAALLERNKENRIDAADTPVISKEEFEASWANEHPFLNYEELIRCWELCSQDEAFIDKSFTDWLQMRRRSLADKWWFLTGVMEMDLVESVHRELVDHLVAWDNVGLKRNYTRKEFHEYLLNLDRCHRRLCCMPRSFYKSTTVQADLVRAQLALPDLTTLIITATHSLAKRFVKTVRNVFVASTTRTLLHQLYPEFTIEDTEGSELEFWNPMARFALADPSVRASSMGATGAGSHVLYEILDDAIDEENGATAELRESLAEKMDAVLELLDLPFAFVQFVGTRYAGGNVGADDGSYPDLYGVLLDREEKADEKTLKVLIKGAWTVKPHAQYKTISELQEHDVELLWPRQADGVPTKGEWRVLKPKRDANLQNFTQQMLNIPCGFETERIKPFDMPTLERCLCDSFDIPSWVEHYAFWDLGGKNERSDFSCGIVVDRSRDTEGRTHLWIKDVKFLKMKQPDLAIEIAMQFRESGDSLRVVAIEKPADESLLEDAIMAAARIRCSRPVPVKWLQTSNVADAKLARVRQIQLLMGETVQIHFVRDQPWQKLLFAQMCNYRGKKSGSSDHLKDDGPDTLGLIVSHLAEVIKPPEQKPMAEDEVEAMRKAWEADAGRRNREALQAIMWGNNSHVSEQVSEPEEPQDPISRIKRSMGLIR